MEKKTKALELIGKRIDVDIVTKSVSINEDKHQATFIMSTSSVDRHGDIVDQESWNLTFFRQNPAFFFNHDSSDFPLGKWVSVDLVADPELPGKMMLVGTAEFAIGLSAEIDRAWGHVVRGDLNMVSVGFIPRIVDYDEVTDAFVMKSCELLECSLVGIGSNRRALIKSTDAKENLIDTKKQLEESIEPGNPAANRTKNAIDLINKAIRQLQK